MLAAVLKNFNKLELEEVPMPRATGFGEVVVKIKSCGFCATDYKAIKGIRTNVQFHLSWVMSPAASYMRSAQA